MLRYKRAVLFALGKCRFRSLGFLKISLNQYSFFASGFLFNFFFGDVSSHDFLAEKTGGKGSLTGGVGHTGDWQPRQGVLKYKCYSTNQVDSNNNPVLLREAGLFSKIPEQVVVCSDINRNFTMLAVRTCTSSCALAYQSSLFCVQLFGC